MTLVDDFCDYCGVTEHPLQLRVVGTVKGLPLVKVWCGRCEVPDDIDRAAQETFLNKLFRGGRR